MKETWSMCFPWCLNEKAELAEFQCFPRTVPGGSTNPRSACNSASSPAASAVGTLPVAKSHLTQVVSGLPKPRVLQEGTEHDFCPSTKEDECVVLLLLGVSKDSPASPLPGTPPGGAEHRDTSWGRSLPDWIQRSYSSLSEIRTPHTQ